MREYTEGPWGIERSYDARTMNESGYLIKSSINGKNDYVVTYLDENCKKEDAQLIAAAPELLEAAEEISMVLKSEKAGKKALNSSLDRLEKAIRKAKGEE